MLQRRRIHDDRQHGEQRHRPDACADDARHDGRPVRDGPDGVAYGDVAVSAHDGQREDAGEPVDGRLDIEELAEGVPEDPRAHDGRRYEEGQADEEAQVGDRQVQDVHVRHRLHLGVAQHDEDDQPVAKQTNGADESVQRRKDHRQRRHAHRSVVGHIAHRLVPTNHVVEDVSDGAFVEISHHCVGCSYQRLCGLNESIRRCRKFTSGQGKSGGTEVEYIPQSPKSGTQM